MGNESYMSFWIILGKQCIARIGGKMTALFFFKYDIVFPK